MPDRIRITIRQVLGISVTGLFAACIDHFRLNTLDLAERSRCIDFRIIFKPGFYGTTIAEWYGFRIFLRFSFPVGRIYEPMRAQRTRRDYA